MKSKIPWKSMLLSILFCLLVGAAASLLTLDGLRAFNAMAKPPLTPPQIVFPIAWTILLILIGAGFGIALAQLHAEPVDRDRAMSAFAIQMTFFFCWMIWFFGLGWYGFSAIWLCGLIGSILWMMRAYHRLSPTACWLQLPYLLWCCFALYLNLGVWRLNG